MILANCPRCNESIRFPDSDLPPDAQAQCPWCAETFDAQDVASQLPPVVQIFDGSGRPVDLYSAAPVALRRGGEDYGMDEEAASDEGESGGNETIVDDTWQDDNSSMPTQLADDTIVADSGMQLADLSAEGDLEVQIDEAPEQQDEGTEQQFEELQSVNVEHADDSASNDFRIEETGPIVEESYEIVKDESIISSSELDQTVAPMRVRSSSRSKPRRSGLRTLLGVALGPVLALPIAGLIFYALNVDLGFWPLDGGRSRQSGVIASAPMDLGDYASFNDRDPSNDDEAESISTPGTAQVDREHGDSTPGTLTSDNMSADDVSLDNNFWSSSQSADSSEDGGEELLRINDDPTLNAIASDGIAEELPAASGELEMPAPTGEIETPTPTGELETPADTSVADQKIILPDRTSESVSILSAAEKDKADDSESDSTPSVLPEVSEDITQSESDEVVAAIDLAKKNIDELEMVDKSSDSYRKLLARTYATIAAVGDIQETTNGQSIPGLINHLKRSANLDDFAAATPVWLVIDNRTSEGVLLVGRPGTGATGPIITLGDGTKVSVETDAESAPAGDRVIALGRILSPSPNAIVRIVAVETIE